MPPTVFAAIALEGARAAAAAPRRAPRRVIWKPEGDEEESDSAFMLREIAGERRPERRGRVPGVEVKAEADATRQRRTRRSIILAVEASKL